MKIQHPAWSRNATIYQLNTRQFTKEGTFAAAEAHLPRLKELGADIVWLMPIHPIGEKNRKGSLGSPYSVKDYRGVNPELGSLKDLKHFVEAAHALGMHVILDWVANHTAWDNPLLLERERLPAGLHAHDVRDQPRQERLGGHRVRAVRGRPERGDRAFRGRRRHPARIQRPGGREPEAPGLLRERTDRMARPSEGELYRKLFALKKRNTALWNGHWGAPMVKVPNDAPTRVLSFVRQNDTDKVFAVINFSGQPQSVTFEDTLHYGRYTEDFSGNTSDLGDSSRLTLEPWGYRAFVR